MAALQTSAASCCLLADSKRCAQAYPVRRHAAAPQACCACTATGQQQGGTPPAECAPVQGGLIQGDAWLSGACSQLVRRQVDMVRRQAAKGGALLVSGYISLAFTWLHEALTHSPCAAVRRACHCRTTCRPSCARGQTCTGARLQSPAWRQLPGCASLARPRPSHHRQLKLRWRFCGLPCQRM